MASGTPFLRVTRNVPRRNYHALNNGRSFSVRSQWQKYQNQRSKMRLLTLGRIHPIARLRLNRHRNLRAPHRLLLRS